MLSAHPIDSDATQRIRTKLLQQKLAGPPPLNVERQWQPEPGHRWVTPISGALVVIAVSAVSFAWVSVDGIAHHSFNPIIAVLALVGLAASSVFAFVIRANESRNRMERAVFQMVRVSMQAEMEVIRTELKVMCDDLAGRIDSLPGRFDLYADQRLTDWRADEDIASDSCRFNTTAGPSLSIVRTPDPRQPS